MTCAFCQSPISPDEPAASCPACHAPYHEDCWKENGGCAVYGCSQTPPAESRRAIDIPASYWGQENKSCPKCGREILAAAVRCRHCGAMFESARPQGADEFQRRTAVQQRLPALRRTVVWLFVVSAIPCGAPVGAVWGLVWYPAHRQDVRELPSLYGALCKIALGLSIGQTVAITLLTALYVAVRR
jgi:hypothetical protein